MEEIVTYTVTGSPPNILPYNPPLIPAQWVPVTEYYQLVAMVERLSERIAALEQRLSEAEGEM